MSNFSNSIRSSFLEEEEDEPLKKSVVDSNKKLLYKQSTDDISPDMYKSDQHRRFSGVCEDFINQHASD